MPDAFRAATVRFLRAALDRGYDSLEAGDAYDALLRVGVEDGVLIAEAPRAYTIERTGDASMSQRLWSYLEVERVLLDLTRAEDPLSEQVGDALDAVWHRLTAKEQARLNGRSASSLYLSHAMARRSRNRL